MKYENYLVLSRFKGEVIYRLARGYKLEEDSRLAYCKFVDPDSQNYAIIDVATGLFIVKSTSKKKVFEKWNKASSDTEFIKSIMKARYTKTYLIRVEQLTAEKRIWRESGYLIEGK